MIRQAATYLQTSHNHMSQQQLNIPAILPTLSQLQASLMQNMQNQNCTSPIPSIIYLWNLRNALQNQVLKLQLTALANGAALNLPQLSEGTTVSIPSPMMKTSIGSPLESVVSTTNSDCTLVKTETIENIKSLPNDPDICLEAQIKYMVQFFVNSFGKVTEIDVQAERKRFGHDQNLIKVFDALVAKYTSTTKTREEMIKWVVRRALKSCKQIIRKGEKISPKRVVKNLCEKYFKNPADEVKKEEEEEINQAYSLLPFRKNSKNKTMNASFITEIFASEEFRRDYQAFLAGFDEITDKDTVKKSSKFTSYLIECVKKDSIKNIAKYKRVPWLNLWVLNTKKVAVELEEGGVETKFLKKIKFEEEDL